ncbi:MAG: hypothetical protein AB7O65_09520 [Candidatus Korobacteraceae bacterium]
MKTLLQLSLCLLFALSLAAQVPKGASENAALRYWNAFAQMSDQKLTDSQIKHLEDIANGTAPWDESAFGSLLDENRDAVVTMVRGTALPYCDWGVDYQLADTAPIPQVGRGRALARLNALTARRLAAQGKSREATDYLIAGIRFARDLSTGMSLIGVLVGKFALTNDLNTAMELERSGQLSSEDKMRLAATLRALPAGVFNWGHAIGLEADVIDSVLRRLQKSDNPSKLLETWGMQEAAKDSRLTDADIRQVRELMIQAEKLFSQTIMTSEEIHQLQQRVAKLRPVARAPIPSFQRTYERRKEQEDLRQKAIGVLSSRP